MLAVSAALTEEHKLLAEFFEDKIFSLGISAANVVAMRGAGTIEFVQVRLILYCFSFSSVRSTILCSTIARSDIRRTVLTTPESFCLRGSSWRTH